MQIQLNFKENFKWDDKIQEAVKKGLIINGTQIVNRAKSTCPVDTGRLYKNIKYEYEDNKNEMQIIIYNNVEYAPYIEFGTKRGIKAHHFFRNAMFDYHQDIKEIIVSEIRKVL